MSGSPDQKNHLPADAKVGAREQAGAKKLKADFFKASKAGAIDIIQEALLKDKSLVDSQDDDDSTALHHAVENNHHPIVIILLTNHANTTLRNKGSYNALDIAVKNANVPLVRLLMVKATLDMLKKAMYVIEDAPAEPKNAKKLSPEAAAKEDEHAINAACIRRILQDEIRVREGIETKRVVSNILSTQQKEEALKIIAALAKLPQPPVSKKPQANTNIPLVALPNSGDVKVNSSVATVQNDSNHSKKKDSNEVVVLPPPCDLAVQSPKPNNSPDNVKEQPQAKSEDRKSQHQQRKKQARKQREAQELDEYTKKYIEKITIARTFFSPLLGNKKPNDFLAKLNIGSKQGESLHYADQQQFCEDDKDTLSNNAYKIV